MSGSNPRHPHIKGWCSMCDSLGYLDLGFIYGMKYLFIYFLFTFVLVLALVAVVKFIERKEK